MHKHTLAEHLMVAFCTLTILAGAVVVLPRLPRLDLGAQVIIALFFGKSLLVSVYMVNRYLRGERIC